MRKTRSQTQKSQENTIITAFHRQANGHSKEIPTASIQPMPNNNNSGSSNVCNDQLFRELHHKVLAFRVADLQRILTQLNHNTNGRKSELQSKIIALLKKDPTSLEKKIREAYTIFQSQTLSATDRDDLSQPPAKRQALAMYQQPMAIPSMQGVPNVGVNNQVVGANNLVFNNIQQPQVPIHPDVRLKRLAFYDIKSVLIQPSTLVAQGTNRTQEAVYHFTLTPAQATEIATNRDIRNGNKHEYTVQVQLRFCLMETSCEQEDCFPPNVIVKVNNKMCPLPNPIPTNRPNVEAKRPPRPVNVTTNVKLSPTVTNSVSVTWSTDFGRGYCIAAFLVKKLTSTELLNRMRAKGVKAADYTRGLIKEKLREDSDCEIATTMLKVSLMCPLGKMKMSIPCRASTCSHLQCFDANLYLQMNERKPTWICPVCDKPAIYDNLVIDGYFQEVLSSNTVVTEIQLHKDGSWSSAVNKPEATVLDTPIKPASKVEIICDDLELIPDVKITSNSQKQEASSSSNSEPASTGGQGVCVDLTLSDSDDDLPLKRRGPASQKNGNKISSTSSSKAKSVYAK